ncbi:RluA family pseudouridine synthase [Rubricoccus marinus]|uniref:Pseudouridine synthase RsuA/RluA-like domain-containing protein n=1 Tax=Rubricoccus marinus TaxID=716817 RepID=A0A259TYX9_9BACT|nr:RNA pseudouridine synthase [Rubricoccus marinus]OZC02900.1 hypothetical protein BSZ36_07890 [Rubricoccus marinus]
MTPEILFLDNHLLVVAKPAGMLSQGDSTGDRDVANWAKAFLKREFNKPGNVFVGLVQRLDRPASGVMVLARTSKAASRLTEQFRKRSVEKVYLALVEGKLEGSGRLEDWLFKTHDTETGTRVKRVSSTTSGAKKAVLEWRALATVRGRTLVRVVLETGRPHQVRVQLGGIGHPIVGDLRYAAPVPLGDGHSIALHAAHLALDHPTQKDRRRFTAAPPPAWGEDFARPIEAELRVLAGRE